MNVYHNTFHAPAILAEGFKDATDYYLTSQLWTGVWVSDRPLDCNEGADGDTLLALDIPEEEIASFEWVEEDKPYREFLVPSDVLNRYGPPSVCEPLPSPAKWRQCPRCEGSGKIGDNADQPCLVCAGVGGWIENPNDQVIGP